MIKARPTINLNCPCCGKEFSRFLYHYRFDKKHNPSKEHFCSLKCHKIKTGTSKLCKCSFCSKDFFKTSSQISRTKNNFCSRSCAGTYNNLNKIHGVKRSKLEKWLEEKLSKTFPNLNIHFNKKDAINSELDIYIPELKLAFELNGIFHYEPIFGQDKLDKIQNNDQRKFQACLENGIEFCILDTSSQKYFKESSSQKYLDIIIKLVNLKLSKTDCEEVL